jgi:hypothetical protein
MPDFGFTFNSPLECGAQSPQMQTQWGPISPCGNAQILDVEIANYH